MQKRLRFIDEHYRIVDHVREQQACSVAPHAIALLMKQRQFAHPELIFYGCGAKPDQQVVGLEHDGAGAVLPNALQCQLETSVGAT
jgi:hypothetical protein